MHTKRIIPCLDVNGGRVVKGVNFVALKDAGDPVEIAKAYDKAGADELVFLDITASSDNRNTVADMVRNYNRRRTLVVESFREMGLSCFEPRGAFYAFPSIKSTGLSSEEFCKRLIFEKSVACVPGTAFGQSGEGYIRCSYAASTENIIEALKRIREFVEACKN